MVMLDDYNSMTRDSLVYSTAIREELASMAKANAELQGRVMKVTEKLDNVEGKLEDYWEGMKAYWAELQIIQSKFHQTARR